MNRRRRSTLIPVALATFALVASACGGSTDSAAPSTPASAGSEPPPVSEVPTSSEPTVELAGDPTTTSAPEATVAPATTPATTAAPATTMVPVTTVAERDVTLRTDAIGDLAFGSATPNDLLDLLSPILGNATRIESLAYPDDQDPARSFYSNLFEERGFAFPFGTDICYDNGLCAYFGGAQPDAVSLVGYRQSEGDESLATASGVTAGSRGADFVDTIIAEEGGCYSTGGGSADGVRLFLRSDGEPFGDVDPETNQIVPQTPPLQDITVLALFSGEESYDLYADC